MKLFIDITYIRDIVGRHSSEALGVALIVHPRKILKVGELGLEGLS